MAKLKTFFLTTKSYTSLKQFVGTYIIIRILGIPPKKLQLNGAANFVAALNGYGNISLRSVGVLLRQIFGRSASL